MFFVCFFQNCLTGITCLCLVLKRASERRQCSVRFSERSSLNTFSLCLFLKIWNCEIHGSAEKHLCEHSKLTHPHSCFLSVFSQNVLVTSNVSVWSSRLHMDWCTFCSSLRIMFFKYFLSLPFSQNSEGLVYGSAERPLCLISKICRRS
jgi:hypothetical protein